MGLRRSRGGGGVLSVVVPAKDEAASLPQLVEEIARALRPLVAGRRLGGFEVVVVDDGSTDETAAVLARLAAEYPELTPVRLAETVGQSAATAAGFREARGEWVATLDADLQNDPADLVALWNALPGHDGALGWRVKREDVWSKRVISRWANRVRNAVLGQSIRDTGCSVRIFPREAALRLPMFRGGHRFFGPLLIREGCSIVQVPVGHRPRSHGKTHYNLWNRSARVVVDLLGVAWLMHRDVRYRVVASSVEAPTSAPQSTPNSNVGPGGRSGRRWSEFRCRSPASLGNGLSLWIKIGFLGQGIFTARFLVQWAVSEKRRDSVVPVAFWWISLFGGLTLLAYTVHKQDPPLILGQAMGLFVYIRNLMLVGKARRRAERSASGDEVAAAEGVLMPECGPEEARRGRRGRAGADRRAGRMKACSGRCGLPWRP